MKRFIIVLMLLVLVSLTIMPATMAQDEMAVCTAEEKGEAAEILQPSVQELFQLGASMTEVSSQDDTQVQLALDISVWLEDFETVLEELPECDLEIKFEDAFRSTASETIAFLLMGQMAVDLEAEGDVERSQILLERFNFHTTHVVAQYEALVEIITPMREWAVPAEG